MLTREKKRKGNQRGRVRRGIDVGFFSFLLLISKWKKKEKKQKKKGKKKKLESHGKEKREKKRKERKLRESVCDLEVVVAFPGEYISENDTRKEEEHKVYLSLVKTTSTKKI